MFWTSFCLEISTRVNSYTKNIIFELSDYSGVGLMIKWLV